MGNVHMPKEKAGESQHVSVSDNTEMTEEEMRFS
jgi:hypothetical protein